LERIRRDTVLETRNFPLRVPAPREGRILFLLEPGSGIYADLAKSVPLQGGTYVSYVDIRPDSPSITIDGFEVVPSSSGGG
jgi:hypothetical protein